MSDLGYLDVFGQIASKFRQLELDNKSLQDEVYKYRLETQTLRENLHEADQLKYEIQALHEEVQRKKDELNQSKQENQSLQNQLQKKIDELIEQKVELQKFHIEANKSLEDANFYRRENESLQTELRGLREEIEKNTHTYATVISENNNFRSEMSSLQHKFQSLLDENSDIRSHHETNLQIIREIKEKSQIEIEGYQKSLDRYKKYRGKVRLAARNSVFVLRGQVRNLQQMVETLKKQSTKTVNELNQQSVTLKNQVSAELKSAAAKNERAIQEIKRLRDENKYLKEDNERVAAQLSPMKKRLLEFDEIEIALAQKTREVEKVKQELNEMKSELSQSMDTKIVNLENFRAAERKFTDIIEGLRQKEQKHNEVLDEKDQEILVLKRELGRQNQTFQKRNNFANQISEENEKLKNELEALKSRNNNLEKTLLDYGLKSTEGIESIDRIEFNRITEHLSRPFSEDNLLVEEPQKTFESRLNSKLRSAASRLGKILPGTNKAEEEDEIKLVRLDQLEL